MKHYLYHILKMIETIDDIIDLYKGEFGISLVCVSNKQLHKRLKSIKRSLWDYWEKQMVQVDVNIGNGRIIKMQRHPNMYWQLHVHALRKDIIDRIKILGLNRPSDCVGIDR